MKTVIESPIGPLGLASDGRGLVGVRFGAREPVSGAPPAGVLAEAARQLAEYFDRRRRTFDLPLGLTGTPFQLDVWQALQQIPYGETLSYADLARRVGRPAAIRAVGAANGRNPIPIIVPCHRVIGSTGALVGFGGGLDVKRRLLALEGQVTMAFDIENL